MTANLFDALKRMNVEKPESLHAYFSNNLENVNAGKQGWGNVKIAITTGDAQEIMNGIVSKTITKDFMLFVVDRKVLDSMREEDEKMDKITEFVTWLYSDLWTMEDVYRKIEQEFPEDYKYAVKVAREKDR